MLIIKQNIVIFNAEKCFGSVCNIRGGHTGIYQSNRRCLVGWGSFVSAGSEYGNTSFCETIDRPNY